MTTGFIDTSVGRLHYRREGSGPALLLLHGNGQSSRAWGRVVPLLSPDYDVVAWDMPGQGDSDHPGRHLTIEAIADCLVEMMDGLDINRAIVAGSSVGGYICSAIGAAHANRVTHLIFVETMFVPRQFWLDAWDDVERQWALPAVSAEQLRPRLRSLTDRDLEIWNVDRFKAGPVSMMSVMWALRDYGLMQKVHDVSAPSSVIAGAKGPTASNASALRAALDAAVGGVELIMLSESGHYPMLDEPEDFAAAVRRLAPPVGGPTHTIAQQLTTE
jgi:pimeloyl-ACP methyl ester carboxylesterase